MPRTSPIAIEGPQAAGNEHVIGGIFLLAASLCPAPCHIPPVSLAPRAAYASSPWYNGDMPAPAMTLGNRRPHFRRHDPPPLRLTADDIAIVRHVARHRFLRSTHIVRLIGRPPKKVVERLGALYHTGYLDRPRAQLDYYATIKRPPYVYGLGNRGADLLLEIDGAERPKVDWTDKNREAGRPFIEHTLLVADLMVALACALHGRPDVSLIEPEQILAAAPEATRRAPAPFKFTARTEHGDLAVIPDRVFGLDFTMERKRKYFFLEADRATMPVMRASLLQTSMYRKFLAYAAGGAPLNAFGRQLGIGSFRVLTVSTSAERTRHMLDALQQATRGSRQFLFADRTAIDTASDLLTLPWLSGKGDRVRLLD